MDNECKSGCKIIAVILAAGAGRRIGMPKWQLKINGKSFLEILHRKLVIAGIADIYCVVREESIPTLKLNYIINPAPEHGMISSAYYAVKESPAADFYLTIPVDHPFVSAQTIQLLCSHIGKIDSKIIRPVHMGRGGHPVIIPRSVITLLPQMYEGGMRQFFSDCNIEYHDVEVDDADILRNVNLPEELASNIINHQIS